MRIGFPDAWKGQYEGRQVVVKVLRVCSNKVEEVRRVGPLSLMCVLTDSLYPTEVLPRGCDMEKSPPSKHAITVRRGNDGGSVRDCVRVDGEW